MGKPFCSQLIGCPVSVPKNRAVAGLEKRKKLWLRLLVMGYRFFVNNAFLMENYQGEKVT